MAYDSVQGQVVLFGGAALDNNTNTVFLNDTWVWDGTNWTEKLPVTSPPARARHSMAYDTALNQTVLFGGRALNGAYDGDTWTWFGGPPPVPAPSISAVVSASAFGGFTSVAPGSWVEIYGSNLAPDTRPWSGSDFKGTNAPTSLDGVQVTIGNQNAFIDYISSSPGQVNAQLPSNIATGGTLQLTLTNGDMTSAPFNITVNATQPGLLAPATFKIGGNQYVVAILPDGSYVLPTGAIAGVNSRPAKPGETVVMYGIGFGPVTPDIPAGQIAEGQTTLADFNMFIGGSQATVQYDGLAPSFVGLYQFDVVVPTVPDSDLVPLTFALGGAAGTQTLFTAVQQ